MKIPRHVAIIPDGNRRYAKEHGLPAFEGHRLGFERAIEISTKARELGVTVLTLWGFSTENWKRSQDEVNKLMTLFEIMIGRYLKDALKNGVRLLHIGRKDRLPKKLLSRILEAEKQTEAFNKYYFVLAIDYGGQDEILRAAKKLVNDKVSTNDITESLFNKYLDTACLPYPYPDLIIRTSGENRLSGYLPWQSVYAELIFIKEYFPAFTPKIFAECLEEYSRRKRNFGA